MALTVESFMPSEKECAEALREARWAPGLIFPHCDSRAATKRGPRGYNPRHHCKDCGKWFNDKTMTPMGNSKLPLRTWFFAAFTLQSKVSVKELSRTLDLPYATTYKMVKKLRRNLHMKAPRLGLEGIVEIYETHRECGAQRPQARLGIGLERAEYTPVGEETPTSLSEGMQAASMNQEARLLRGGLFTIGISTVPLPPALLTLK